MQQRGNGTGIGCAGAAPGSHATRGVGRWLLTVAVWSTALWMLPDVARLCVVGAELALRYVWSRG